MISEEGYYDSEEEDLEHYIQAVSQRVGKCSKKKITEALESCGWNIEKAVKKIKEQSTSKPTSKPAPKPAPSPAPKVVPPKKQEETPKLEHKVDLNIDYPDVNTEQPETSKPTINLVVIGHVDSGKSTLMGHLLCSLGYIDQRTIHKYEKESKEIGKDSFYYAWVLDAGTQERERGVTIDVGCSYFSTPNRNIMLLDAPGHKDFVPKMISGAAQADAAILVVDSGAGNFESGFEGEVHHGQTKEHAFLARSLGVTNLIVAVNKIDIADWSQERFENIKQRLKPFLKTVGFKESSVDYIPISGMIGENLVERTQNPNLSWYQGPCLLEMIDTLPPATRAFKKPLRLCVMDSYKLAHGSILGHIVAGKIEGGMLSVGDCICVIPAGVKAQVRNIEKTGETVSKAYAGDNVDVALRDSEGDFELIMPGHVVCSPLYPIPQVTKFLVKAVTFDIVFPVTKGQSLIMHIQSLKVPVKVNKILQQIEATTGKVVKERPRCLTKFTAGILEIQTENKVCIEKFSNYKGLGRATFRERSETVMAGMVTELLE